MQRLEYQASFMMLPSGCNADLFAQDVSKIVEKETGIDVSYSVYPIESQLSLEKNKTFGLLISVYHKDKFVRHDQKFNLDLLGNTFNYEFVEKIAKEVILNINNYLT